METNENKHPDHILVTGATGYIGGRLVPRLLDAGYYVRCLARSPRKLGARPWAEHPRVEIIGGDAEDYDRLLEAMKGCQVAYYLIHSMVAVGPEYVAHDRKLAATFARAAEESGIGRIIYLGGLGETGDRLSEHLSSRREVEEHLASGSVPVTVLRAAMIIGSGSASFEILRYLIELLPVMTAPLWVKTESQPIAVRNVIHYLVACLTTPETTGRILDIGGPEVLRYSDLMNVVAKSFGYRNCIIIPIPALSLKFSAWWVQLITPITPRIALPLIEGLRNRVVCRNDDAIDLMPQRLLPVSEAVDLAVGKVKTDCVETTWSDAGVMPGDPDWSGGTVFTNQYSIDISAPPDVVFREICRIGGKKGYYGADWLWVIRGLMDQLIGGPGLRRGRRHTEHVAYGDAVDFWRVCGIEQDRRLELHAEMKLPGDAYLELEIIPDMPEPGKCRLLSTATFMPRRLPGIAYWISTLWLHEFVFFKMLRGIKHAVESDIQRRTVGDGTW